MNIIQYPDKKRNVMFTKLEKNSNCHNHGKLFHYETLILTPLHNFLLNKPISIQKLTKAHTDPTCNDNS